MIYLCRLPEAPDRRERRRLERRAGWALLRRVIMERLPEAAGSPLESLLEAGAHGKPYFRGKPFHFSLSHSGGVAVCAVETCEVGVDVEQKRRFTPRLKAHICTPGERRLVEASGCEDDALTRLWTMKESYMKYTGLGLAQGIQSTDFCELGDRPKLTEGNAFFQSADLGDVFLTLCTARSVPWELVRLSWDELREYLPESSR